jgi:hypothetical protein
MVPSEEHDAIVVDADDNILGYKNRHTFAQGEY